MLQFYMIIVFSLLNFVPSEGFSSRTLLFDKDGNSYSKGVAITGSYLRKHHSATDSRFEHQCSIQNCIECSDGKCLKCLNGYSVSDNECQGSSNSSSDSGINTTSLIVIIICPAFFIILFCIV